MDYAAPASAEEAAAALAAGGPSARPLGGGTDLLVQLRSGRIERGLLVDLKKIAGAVGIRRSEEGGFVVGAATPGAVIGEDAQFCAAWPGLAEAAMLIGSTQIQGRASLGGNLGNASPAADSVPALLAAQAECEIIGPKGRRRAPVEAIPAGPGRTTLGLGEFILEFRLPPRLPRAADAYLRSIPRTEMDIAVVGAGVDLVLDQEGRIAATRVALGAVAPTPILVEEAAEAIVGSRLENEALTRLERAAGAAASPISDKRGTAEYRFKVVGVIAARAAKIAYGRALEKGQ
ncbi:MAG: FAD binding domain-containing protein [Caulobacteraceae bacterium]